MPYYKTIDEMLKGIGKTSSMSINRDVSQSRYDAVKEIAAGTYNYAPAVPTIPISPYERPRDEDLADVYRGVSVENRLEQREFDEYNPIQKPTTFKEGVSAMWNNFAAGIVNTARTATSIKAPLDLQAVRTDERKLQDKKWAENTAKTMPDWMLKTFQRKAQSPLTKVQVDAVNAKFRQEEAMKATEAGLREKAQQRQLSPKWTKAVEVAGVAPSVLTAAIPGYGWSILATNSVVNSLEGTMAKAKQQGKGIDPEMAYVNAFGNASIDIVTEMMFGVLGGAATALGKKAIVRSTTGFITELLRPVTTKIMGSALGEFAQLTLPKLGAKIITASQGEGFEELVAYIASGYLAKATTDQDATLFGTNDQDALMSIAGMINAYTTGALAAAPTSIVASGVGFVKTAQAAKKINKPLSKFTDADWNTYAKAMHEDMQDPKNREAVTSNNIDLITKAKAQEEGTTPTAPIDDTVPSIQQIISDLETRNEATQQTQEAPVEAEPIAEPVVAQETVQEPVEATMESKNVAELAVNQYGITTDYKEAGYVMPDGKMLDFSEKNNGGEPGQRSMDHRDVSGFYEGISQTEAMNQFIADTGAVRIGVNENNAFADIILDKLPTDKQLQQITRALAKKDTVAIDVYNSSKDNVPVKSIVLDMPLASKIMAEIKDAIKQTPVPESQPIPKKANRKEVKTEQQSPVAKKSVSKEAKANKQADAIDLTKAEVISEKSSTGKVYRIGDKVYKSALFGGKGNQTLEAEAYEALKDSDVIAKGKSVTIDGRPYIELPYYKHILSIDAIKKDDRAKYQSFVVDNADRIIKAVQDLSNAGYNYNDPLQFGYADGKLYLIDFSNVSKDDPNETLADNYNRLGNFFKDFGVDRLDYIVSRGMELRRNLESLVSEDVKSEDYEMILKFTPEVIRDVVDEMKRSRGDMPPNNVYYTTNGRGVEIGNIMQTDRINGVKHIFSETPLSPSVQSDWELKPIYEGAVTSVKPAVMEQKRARLKKKTTVAEERATRPPTITMKVMEENYRSGQDVSADIDAWVDTEEGQKLVGNIKTKKDLAEAIQTLKYDIQGSKVINKDAIAGGYLQLLAYKSWANRIKDVKEGSRISLYMQHMAEAMKYGTDSKTERKIEQSVKDSDLFHQTLADDDVIMQAEKDFAEKGESYVENLSKKIGTKGYQLNPSDVVLISMYAKKLMEDGAETGNFQKGINVLRNLSRLMTQSGRFIHAADIAYKTLFPEYYANAMQHAFRQFVNPQDEIIVDKKVEDTADVARKTRKEIAGDVAKDVDNSVKEATKTKEPEPNEITSEEDADEDAVEKKEETPAEVLARRIKKSIEPMEQKDKDAVQRMLDTLFNKYKEKQAKDKKPAKMDLYSAIYEIIVNRSEYQSVWNEAKQLVQKDEGKNPVLENYFMQLTDPVMAERLISRLAGQTLKDSKTSFVKLAKEYLLKGTESLDGFYEFLAGKLKLDQKSPAFLYLKAQIDKFYVPKVADKAKAIQEAADKAEAERLRKKEEAKKRREERLNNPVTLLSDKIIADINRKAGIPKTLAQQMADKLFRKFKDTYESKSKKVASNPMDMLAEMAKNRQKYADVWSQAREILYTTDKVNNEQAQKYIDYFMQLSNPVFYDNLMNSVVIANIKSMDKTIAEYAREYFFNGDEAISGFYEKLAENMPNLGESGLQYVEQYLAPIFRAKMINQRDVIKDALRKQVARRSGLKKEIDIQELLVNKLTDATYRDALNIPELRDLWAARLGIAHLDQESIADIYQTMRDMYNMKTQEEKDTAYDALASRLAKRIPATALDKYIAFTRTAMLLNPPTWIRNMLSNVTAKPMYRASDVLSNTLQRMMKVPQADRMAGKAVTGFKANSDIGKKILSRTQPSHMERVMRHTNKYAMAQLMGMERRIFKNPVLEKLNKIPGRVMNEGDVLGLKNTLFGDRRMFTDHYRYAMANRMTALGYSETMTEDQKAKILEDAEQYASEYATVRTYRAKSFISQMLNNLGKQIHSAKDIRSASPAQAAKMVRQNKAIKLLMKINIPFVNTPAAIATEVYRFSPYALAVSMVKAGVFTAQGKMREPSYKIQIANEFSQAAVGTFATFIPGIILGMFGFLTGAPPENDKEKEIWALQGKRSYSIYIPGVGSYSIDWLQPLAPGLMMGAAFAQSLGENDNWLEALGKIPTATLDAMLANSIIDSLQRNLGAGYKSSLEKVRDMALSGVYQLMPGILARFNRILDPYVRDTYNGGASQQLFNRLMGTIPFAVLLAPDAVPIKTDIWGRKVTQAHGKGILGTAERAVLNMLSPFIQTKASTDGVTQEVIRVWERTNTSLGNKAIPTAPSNKIDATKDHPEYVLSPKEYELYFERVGSLYYSGIKKKMASDGYYNMTPEEKAKAFDKIYREARETVKETYIKSKGGKP